VNKLIFKRGRIANLHNLIPDMETNFKSISDTYVHHGGVASVIQLDTKLLKSEIEKDDVKIIKLFEIMSNRIIILNP